MKFNYEVYFKWIEALESDEYAQTKGRLEKIDDENNSSFCCIGVACRLLEVSRTVDNGAFNKLVMFGGNNEMNMAPDELIEKLVISGQPTTDFRFIWTKNAEDRSISRNNEGVIALKLESGKIYDLISLNDSFGASFKTIAEVLRCFPHFIENDSISGQF